MSPAPESAATAEATGTLGVCYGGRRSSQPGAAEGCPAQAAAQNRVGLGRRTDGHVDPGRAARALGGRDQAAARAAHAYAGRAPLGDLPAGGHHARVQRGLDAAVGLDRRQLGPRGLLALRAHAAHSACAPRRAAAFAARLARRRARPAQRSALPTRWLKSCSSAPPCSAKPAPTQQHGQETIRNCRRK